MNFNNILSDKNWVFGNKIFFIDSYSLLKDISYKNIYLDELNIKLLSQSNFSNSLHEIQSSFKVIHKNFKPLSFSGFLRIIFPNCLNGVQGFW